MGWERFVFVRALLSALLGMSIPSEYLCLFKDNDLFHQYAGFRKQAKDVMPAFAEGLANRIQ
jgi:hypothetical protein